MPKDSDWTIPTIAHDDLPEFRQINRTGQRLYHRRCSWVRTCARCGQYHGRLHDQSADVPSIPIHISCGCIDNIVEVGETAPGYPPQDVVIPELSGPQQQRYIGKGNFQLWQNGSVKFEDIVTRRRIKPFSVVSSKLKPPASVLDVPADQLHGSLKRWYADAHGLTDGLDTRAATAKLNFVDFSQAVRREFDSIMQDFAVPEAELKKLLGAEIGKQVFDGTAGLRVEVLRTLGNEIGERYLSGKMTADEASEAVANQ